MSDGRESAQKRQQVRRACEPCRRKKRRCHHNIVAATPTTATEGPPGNNSVFQISTSSSLTRMSEAPHVTAIDRQVPEDPALQRVTDVSKPQPAPSSPGIPEREINYSMSQAQNRDDSGLTLDSLASRFVGDLSPESIFLAATSPGATRGPSLNDSIGVWLTTTLNRRASQSMLSVQSSPSNIFHGSASLVQKVLVPVLEQECLSAMPSRAGCDALSEIYFDKIHPIFPVIDQDTYRSLDPTSPSRILLQQCICLAASKNVAAKQYLRLADVGPPLNCREFGDRLTGAMRLLIEMGLVTNKIVLIQALALMSQFVDIQDGGDLSSQLCASAVHHVQSIGLHVRGRQEEHKEKYGRTLLSCIWAIDRMNAAFNGRPVLMHERDVRKDIAQCFEEQKPCFRLFLQIIVLLDKVIELYRPPNPSHEFVLDVDFPSFGDLVLRCDGLQVGMAALATIETLYHAVAILSHRPKTWADPQRSSVPYLRQSLSASTLSSTVGRELQDHLILFQFVPHAMSLSLSVTYREMRHNKIPLHRVRARAQFQTMCDVLSNLAGIFWSASTMADTGKKLLKEMDRVVSAVAATEGKKSWRNNANDSVIATNANDLAPPNLRREQTPTTANGTQAFPRITPDFDPSVFDSVADIDLFGMFDPALDLDSFDALLEGNLTPSFSTYSK